MAIPLRGWGLETGLFRGDPRAAARSEDTPGQDDTQAVRDLIREDLPSIIEATFGQWLSEYEKKQRAWFQEMFREQRAASQAAQSEARTPLWEGRFDELAEAIDGIVVRTEAVVREATRDATKDAVMEAMAQMPVMEATAPVPTAASDPSDMAVPGPRSPANLAPESCAESVQSMKFFRATNPMDTASARTDGGRPPSGPTGTASARRTEGGDVEAASRGIGGDGGPMDVSAQPSATSASQADRELEGGTPTSLLQRGLAHVRAFRKARREYFQQRQDDYLRERAFGRRRGQSNLEYVATSSYFEYGIMVVILLHLMYMIYDTDRSFRSGGISSGADHIIIEVAFWLVYAAELALKLAVEKLDFFTGPTKMLHLLDVFLVVTGLIDIIGLMLIQENVIGTMGLKVVRVVRLNRLARTHRLFLVSDDMQLLMKSLGACAISLTGPFLLLVGYFLVMALWIVPSVLGYLIDSGDTLPPDEVQFLRHNFGSVSRSMFALYQSITGGASWMPLYTTLAGIDKLTVGFPFLIYHFIYTFLMLNIVLCMFLGKIVLFSLDQSQKMKHSQRRQDRQDVTWILEWCEATYGPGNTINYKDFLQLMHKNELRRHFSSRGVNMEDAGIIFKALAPEATQAGTVREWEFNVDRAEFYGACMRLKREVATTDIITANAYLVRSMQKQQALSEDAMLKVENLEARIKAAMKREVGRLILSDASR